MIQQASSAPASVYTNFRRKYYPLFWFVGAVDETIIKECPVAEQDKQAGIGMAIICTTLAALLSGFFAVQSIVHWSIGLPVAFFYALMIFNLDRFMVGSMRKDIDNNKLKEICTAVPRIILATIIALLVVKPIEVKLFKNQIEAANLSLVKNKSQNLLQNDRNILADQKEERKTEVQRRDDLEEKKDCSSSPEYESFQEIHSSCTAKVARLSSAKQQAIANLNAVYHNPTYTVTNEYGHIALNEAGTRKRNNYRSEIQKLADEIINSNCDQYNDSMHDACARYMNDLNNDIREADEKIGKINIQIGKSETAIVNQDTAAVIIYKQASSDILGELEALDQLKSGNPSIRWSSLFISLFFFIIEIAPIAVKILSPRGKYDTLLYITEQAALDHEDYAVKESSHIKEIKIRGLRENEAEISEIERRIHKDLFEKIAHEQAILTAKIVETWRRTEENAIDENPQEYIRRKIKTDNEN